MEYMPDLYIGSKVMNLSPSDFYIDYKGNVTLKASNFKYFPNKIGYIQFYAPWCGHCRNYTSEYISYANLVNNDYMVAAFNATHPDAERILLGLNIDSFPTMTFVPVVGGGVSKGANIVKYDGSRETKKLHSHIMKTLSKSGGKKKSPKRLSGGAKRKSPKRRVVKKRSPKRRSG